MAPSTYLSLGFSGVSSSSALSSGRSAMRLRHVSLEAKCDAGAEDDEA